MKKLFVLFAVLLAALFVVGCASKPAAPAAPAGPSAAELMASAKGGAPMGVLVGQATASSQTTAQNNAVIQVKRGLKAIVVELVDAQVTAGAVASSVSTQLKQAMSAAIDGTTIGGIVKVDSGADVTGRGWAIYSLTKDEALKVITSAANEAKENVAAGNFAPSSGFDNVFAKAAGMEWK